MNKLTTWFLAALCLLGAGLGLWSAQSQTISTPPIFALACANNTVVPTPTSGAFFLVQCNSSGQLLTNGLPATGGSLSGPLNLPAGTAAAPSLTLGTDITTGWYRSDVNQWALSISGVGTDFFNSIGDFFINGIGQANHLASYGHGIQIYDTHNPVLIFSTSSGNHTDIQDYLDDILYDMNSANSFIWRSGASGTYTQRMKISASGNVGIGAAPNGNIAELEISGGNFLTTGTVPTIASGSCGTGTNGSITGTNQSGYVTISTAATTTCTINFDAGHLPLVPPTSCIISPGNAAAAVAATAGGYAAPADISTTVFIIRGLALANTTWQYHCY